MASALSAALHQSASAVASGNLISTFHRNTLFIPPSLKAVQAYSKHSSSHPLPFYTAMTRTNKGNDRNHVGLADGTASAEDHLPRYFAKSGHSDADPTGVKKQGGGKGNWGRDGVEAQDYGYNFTNSRRRSNSSTKALGEFKSKFEGVDVEPVFEETLHGPSEEDVEKASTASLDKEESTDSSTLGGSIEEEEVASADKKM